MARKSHDDALGVAGAETIIGTGVTIKGNLRSETDISIDGNLVGNMQTAGNITLGVNAVIEGDLKASNITIAGTVMGNITASGEASIRETGNVHGDITASGLAITSGGIFVGRSVLVADTNMATQTERDRAAS